MADVEFYKGESSNLNGAKKVDGGIYYTTDTHDLYVSDGTNFHNVAASTTYTVDVPTTGWTENSSTGYSKTITVSGLKEVDEPIVDVVLDGANLTENKNKLTAWYKISKITTSNDALTLYAFNGKPETAIKIKLKVVK